MVFESFNLLARAKGEVCHEYIGYLYERSLLTHDIPGFVKYMCRFQSDRSVEEIPHLVMRDLRTIIANIVSEYDEYEFVDLLDFLIYKTPEEAELCMLEREKILLESEEEEDEEEEDEEEEEVYNKLAMIEAIKDGVRKRLSSKYKTQDKFIESINEVEIGTPLSVFADILAYDADEYIGIVKDGLKSEKNDKIKEINELSSTSSYEEVWEISQDAKTPEISLIKWKSRMVVLSED